ncbi:uncharacterized protein LOC123708319 [Pieris brassicae]|uniref:uncharacterized protein LOC123708319 n=1 Tax=Pieris brassicae TaxID=7116 RepID=UPI001E66082C|nr:uncharacterized protein LOC123708319 [Pieris brassicae]
MRFKFSPRIKPRSALFCRDTIVKGVMVNYGNLIKLLWSSSLDIDIKPNAQSEFNYLVLEVTDGEMYLYFCLVVLSCKISTTLQKNIKNSDIETLIEQLDNNNGSIESTTSNTPGNSSRIIYFKSVTEPKIFKGQPSNVENMKEDNESLDFVYDDTYDNELPNFRRSEHNRSLNKIDTLQNLEKQVKSKAELQAAGSHISNTKTPLSGGSILPNFVIDQIVYEESESNTNFKSTIEELEKKITSHNEKERYKFSRLFQEIKNLYNELDELKKVQEQLNRTQEILTRKDNSANERSGNALNLPTPKCCLKTNNPVRYPMQHHKHANPFVNQLPIINNYPKTFSLPNLPYLRTIPKRFSSNFNNNQGFVHHIPLFKYFH